jgi:hypothetical protein
MTVSIDFSDEFSPSCMASKLRISKSYAWFPAPPLEDCPDGGRIVSVASTLRQKLQLAVARNAVGAK